MKHFLLSDYLCSIGSAESAKMFPYLRTEIEARTFGQGDPIYGQRRRISSFRDLAMTQARKVYCSFMSNGFSTSKSNENILSSAYFGLDELISHRLKKHIYRAPWMYGRKTKQKGFFDAKLLSAMHDLTQALANIPFSELMDTRATSLVRACRERFADVFTMRGVTTFICASSYPIFDRLSIDAIKDIGGKAFMFQHGLPGVYERHMKFYDQSYDLLVWGRAFERKYIELGISADKVHSIGHPFYESLNNIDLQYSLDEILVITKAPSGARVDSQDRMGDQSSALLYLYSIQKVLQSLGVKKAKLRLHPSEKKGWYEKFIDNRFYYIDPDGLAVSLKEASIVIGPTSTTFLESVYFGTPYIVYEPTQHSGMDLFGNPLVMPFDGSDQRIPVAYDEDGLVELLKKDEKFSTSFLADYISAPVDLSVFNAGVLAS